MSCYRECKRRRSSEAREGLYPYFIRTTHGYMPYCTDQETESGPLSGRVRIGRT